MSEVNEQGKELSIHSGVVLRGADINEDDIHSLGSLNIIEYSFGKCIEWRPIEVSVVSECQDQDPEWSLIDTHTTKNRSSSESADILGRVRTVRILFSQLVSIRIYQDGQRLAFTQKDEICHVAFFQLSNADSFLNSLKGYLKFARSKKDRNLYFVFDEVSTNLNKSFAELDIFQENSSDNVWKFVKNFPHYPYETTMEAFSKLADVWIYKEPAKRPVEETVADLLSRSFTHYTQPPTSVASGEEYEVIAKPGGIPQILLPPRPPCHRGAPLAPEQWDRCKDPEGRVINPREVREIIFKGGISPALRYEVWKFLLNYTPWNSTNLERIEIRKKKTDLYFIMKLQWKSITADQETRFSDFRDRKSLIEKDVNRTDRTNPYYSGDNNVHLTQLYDILMTYVMYNFNLGYVQGMSDLLSPILCLMDNEVDAFWCFVGFMDKVSTNFDMDQAGMKAQLCQLHNLLLVTEPQLAKYLDKHDSGNMFFCFRWLLVLFKREFSAIDIMRLWEILWTEMPCKNFHLLFCVAILDHEKSTLINNNYGFTEILKHINDLSLQIDLMSILSEAEGIYHQLVAVGSQLPDHIRSIIGLPPISKTNSTSQEDDKDFSNQGTSVDNSNSSSFLADDSSDRVTNSEVSFEQGLSLNYM